MQLPDSDKKADLRRGLSGATQEDAAKEAHERRREQIRRAQRTHRERKDCYIKNLEAEVVMLRDKDATHEQVVSAFKSKISDLNQILIGIGVPVPEELFHIESNQAAITVQTQLDGIQNRRATMSTLTSTQSQSWGQSDTMPSTTAGSNGETLDLAGTYDKMRFKNIGQAPAQPFQSPARSGSKGHPHDLDRLMNLSSRLSLEGELTPIETWQRIQLHPGFAKLNLNQLQQLEAALLPEVQCCSFGAVIDEQYFDSSSINI